MNRNTTDSAAKGPLGKGVDRAQRDKAHRPHRISRIRGIVFAAVLGVFCASLALPLGVGTPSAFGVGPFALFCPLGWLQSFLASGALPSAWSVALFAVSIGAIILVGTAFCSWACPVSRLSHALRKLAPQRHGCCKGADSLMELVPRSSCWQGIGESISSEPADSTASDSAEAAFEGGEASISGKTGIAVLAGALGSSLVFGFPVFCLVCPVGLSFATIVLVWRMVQYGDMSWGLVVFPLVIVGELLLLRRWCGAICPVGALLSLVSRANRTFEVRVDEGACLRNSEGVRCRACQNACPVALRPFEGSQAAHMNTCVKCGRCVDVCSAQALAFSLREGRKGATVANGSK